MARIWTNRRGLLTAGFLGLALYASARAVQASDPNDWSFGGNSVTADGVLGTTSAYSLDLVVGGIRALRLQRVGSGTPALIGGSTANYAYAGTPTTLVAGATVAGGGSTTSGEQNGVTDMYGTVSGGLGNQAGDGDSNILNEPGITIGGGKDNTATEAYSVVGGGENNTITVAAPDQAAYAVIAGGRDN